VVGSLELKRQCVFAIDSKGSMEVFFSPETKKNSYHLHFSHEK
jgi:hypothetical protein